MPIDISKLPNEQLETLVENHRRKGVTEGALYVAALAELGRRAGRGLDFKKSFAVIRTAAMEKRFVSYKELAEAGGADWSYSVRNRVIKHLWWLVHDAHRKGWPMLSAIVVNIQNVKSGEMEPETLKGFIASARHLGMLVTDEKKFLREQQSEVFAWASTLANQ
jgi:hypothetical protein